MHWRRQMLGTCPGALWYPVLEGECDMRVPQVSERIKEAPAQALRGVFAGIGQLLLITDKLRNKTSASQQVPAARPPEPARTPADTAPAPVSSAAAAAAASAAAAAAPAPSAASASASAAPAPAPAAAAASGAAAPASATAAPASAAPAPAASAPAAARVPATARVPAARNFDKTGNVRLLTSAEAAADTKVPAPAPAEAAEAPLPNYDALSMASLRARLRNLDPTELRQLVAYEQT